MPRTTVRTAIAENCSQHLDLIDEDGSGDLDAMEIETLLAAMGITGPEQQKILLSALDGSQKTKEHKVTDAILLHADINETKLQVMLGRVALFGNVFRWLDFDGDGTLSLPEIIRMMELLNIDLKLAADLMAFLDSDDSGEITWQEFVRGICSKNFASLFPQITLEALVELPSSLQQNKFIGEEEEKRAIAELPSIEKSLYWVLSIMYSSTSLRKREETTFDLDLTEIPARFKASKDCPVESPPTEVLATDDQKDDELRSTANSRSFVIADIPCVVRKKAKNPQAVRPAVVYPSFPDGQMPWVQLPGQNWQNANPFAMSIADVPCVVRKEARNPLAVRPAIIHPKFPDAELQWVQFPDAKPRTPKTPEARCIVIEPEKPKETEARRASTISLQASAAAALSSALTGLSGVASGLASAFGLPSKDSSKKKGLSVGEAATVIKNMDVKKAAKAHVLNEQKRRSLWRCRYAAILTGALAGVGAAFLAQVLNDFTSTIVDEEEDFVMWNVLAGLFSLLWSLAEMLVCCIAALVATVRMTRICGINLVPMDKERAMLAGSLARSALELGHPKVRTFGIDPYKRANKYLLLFYALIYMGSRGITKFVVKLIVKKAAPRTLLKVTKFAPLLVEVLINLLFNTVTVNYAMNEVMICSVGPSATVEVTSQLIKAHRHSLNVEEPLSDEVKLLALRAVGVSITYKMQLHPNSRFLLNHVVGLFADQSFVKRAKEDYFNLKGVQHAKSLHSHRSHAPHKSGQSGCCGRRSGKEAPAETLHEELADLGLDEEDLFFDGLTGRAREVRSLECLGEQLWLKWPQRVLNDVSDRRSYCIRSCYETMQPCTYQLWHIRQHWGNLNETLCLSAKNSRYTSVYMCKYKQTV